MQVPQPRSRKLLRPPYGSLYKGGSKFLRKTRSFSLRPSFGPIESMGLRLKNAKEPIKSRVLTGLRLYTPREGSPWLKAPAGTPIHVNDKPGKLPEFFIFRVFRINHLPLYPPGHYHSLAHLRGLPALRGENQAHALRFTIHACPDSFARSSLSAFVMKSSSRITRKYPETPTLQNQQKQEISGYMKKYPEISGYKSKHVLHQEISGNSSTPASERLITYSSDSPSHTPS